MSSLTLIVPEVTATPKRLSEYGALTVALTRDPAVQAVTAVIATLIPGTLAEFVGQPDLVERRERLLQRFR